MTPLKIILIIIASILANALWWKLKHYVSGYKEPKSKEDYFKDKNKD